MQRRQKLVRIFAAVVFVLAAAPAQAACRWTWDCTQQPCRQVHLCDNSTDVPAIRPTEVPPTPPTSLAPITSPMNPPTGTTECRQANLCNSAGQCRWQTVCR
jgi:hypothetical protein